MRRILIVEDEPNIANVVKAYVEKEGFQALIATDGRIALDEFAAKKPDAVILDVMLPQVDGFEVARQIRRSSNTPIIMLTARVDEIDRILGLELGADDYVLKPFSPRELVARVKAVLRRAEASAVSETLRVGELVLDVTAHAATAAGAPLQLTPAEFAILEKLMREPGRAFTRLQLLDAFDASLEGLERNSDTHIKNLRKKIGQHLSESYIQTVYGVGYKLESPRV